MVREPLVNTVLQKPCEGLSLVQSEKGIETLSPHVPTLSPHVVFSGRQETHCIKGCVYILFIYHYFYIIILIFIYISLKLSMYLYKKVSVNGRNTIASFSENCE